MAAILSPPLDSSYHPRLLQELGVNPVELLKTITQVLDFIPREQPEMKYRGRPLKRDKFFLVRSNTNAEGDPMTYYKYSYPGFQYASLLHYRPFSAIPAFEALVVQLEKRLGCTFNHAIGTRYSLPTDEIGYHADKMLDIEPDTPIVSLSFLDVREFHLRLKDSKELTPSHIQVLRDGDVFVLGPETNDKMEHAVPPVARETKVIRMNGKFEPRVSIVLRQIRTSLTREQVLKKIKQASAAKEVADGRKELVAASVAVPILCGVLTKRGLPCRNKQGSCPYHK